MQWPFQVGIGPLNKKGLRLGLFLLDNRLARVGIGPLNKKGLRHIVQDPHP